MLYVLRSLHSLWCLFSAGSDLELGMVCFRNSIGKFLRIMGLRIFESLPSGHVCHVFATVYIYNYISYLSTYCIFQTKSKITMQTSLFRTPCVHSLEWRWRIGGVRHSKGWFDDMSSQPFLLGQKTHLTDPTSWTADWLLIIMFLQQLSRSFCMTCCSFFSYKLQMTWIIWLSMSPEVVSKASKAAKAMLGMSWLADKSPGAEVVQANEEMSRWLGWQQCMLKKENVKRYLRCFDRRIYVRWIEHVHTIASNRHASYFKQS